ncbi:hypothetical protein [Wenjunlia tyrosinilytica]|uniref:Uncharacterized protein n=1 Tax=Wenjunlia tyrosinilytica TaxID=1544741 RepID=A0A917ZF49_9ACTN|nr:hypothetical protein [Wenjunlia tyrosinilytica]GGO81850.1 hypothetical protein GCM10012280_07100 [Wenjunlia tyrosinilytica]
MGYTVLYIAFGVVALWLLGEVLMQYKARLRWRLLAFAGFMGVVAGVAMRSIAVISLGAIAFAIGQTFVTMSYRRGYAAGWALVGRPGMSRRGQGGGAAEQRPVPTLSVSPIEPAGSGSDARDSAPPVYQPEAIGDDTGEYAAYTTSSAYVPDPSLGHDPSAGGPYDGAGYGYGGGYGQNAYDTRSYAPNAANTYGGYGAGYGGTADYQAAAYDSAAAAYGSGAYGTGGTSDTGSYGTVNPDNGYGTGSQGGASYGGPADNSAYDPSGGYGAQEYGAQGYGAGSYDTTAYGYGDQGGWNADPLTYQPPQGQGGGQGDPYDPYGTPPGGVWVPQQQTEEPYPPAPAADPSGYDQHRY